MDVMTASARTSCLSSRAGHLAPSPPLWPLCSLRLSSWPWPEGTSSWQAPHVAVCGWGSQCAGSCHTQCEICHSGFTTCQVALFTRLAPPPHSSALFPFAPPQARPCQLSGREAGERQSGCLPLGLRAPSRHILQGMRRAGPGEGPGGRGLHLCSVFSA